MEENKSWCCGVIPKGLWWLLTLLGLPLLYFLMFNANKDPIESDLSQRVMGSLTEEKMPWVNVDVDERGRDIILSGEAPSEEAKTQALSIAQGVKGVRIAEANFTDYVPTDNLSLNVNFKDGKMVLDGTVASQDEMDAIVKAAVERVGEANVVNNLTISKSVKPSGWLAKFSGLMALVVEGGSLSASADGVKYTGIVDSEDRQNGLLSDAKGLLDSFGIPVVNGLTIVEPKQERTEDLTLSVNLKDGKMVLDGTVASQEEMNAIVKAAIEKVGEANVVNNLKIGETVKPSDWLGRVSGLMALVVEGGSLSASADGVKYTGIVDSEDRQNGLLSDAKGLLDSFGISVMNGLTIVEPKPEPVPEPEPAPEPVVTAKEIKINACQGKMNDVMAGKSIHFRLNAAVIQQASHALLDNIASVMNECKDEISGGVTINGHTDSTGNDAYNMALSLRRASAVRDYLKNRKVDPALLKSVGHGETSPIADNGTPAGRADNRRITFIINKN